MKRSTEEAQYYMIIGTDQMTGLDIDRNVSTTFHTPNRPKEIHRSNCGIAIFHMAMDYPHNTKR
jgi:hypothetical protein